MFAFVITSKSFKVLKGLFGVQFLGMAGAVQKGQSEEWGWGGQASLAPQAWDDNNIAGFSGKQIDEG